MKKEYIVTLHNYDDLENFYMEMESKGGTPSVPPREVTCALRRPISRNTHYFLTIAAPAAVDKITQISKTEWQTIANAKPVFAPIKSEGANCPPFPPPAKVKVVANTFSKAVRTIAEMKNQVFRSIKFPRILPSNSL